MNPFLYKAHPVMQASIGLLTGVGSYGISDAIRLLVIFFAINVPYGALLSLVARKSAGMGLRFGTAYILAFPATLLYTPISLTFVDDVLHHAFRLEDRYLFLFALGVAAVMLAAVYGVVLHHRGGQPVGSEVGLILAMALLLAAVPCSILLLGLDAWVSFFPARRSLE